MERSARSRASELRLAVARRIADAYAAAPSVVAVVCAGSTARGHADRWSDLELLVVWGAPPRDEQRRGVVAAAAGRDPRSWAWDARDGACYDEWWHGGPAGGGLLVEVTHTTPTELVARIDALVGGEADSPLLTLGDAIVNGVPLVDRDVLTTWRARLVPYPRALALAVVRRHGQIDHFWRWRMYVERDNLLQLGAHLSDVAARLVHVACALSGVWWPGAKWLPSLAAHLPVAPANLANRLQQIPRAAPGEAAATLAALVEETYDLVEVHLPDIDVARLRAIFQFARRPDEARPGVGTEHEWAPARGPAGRAIAGGGFVGPAAGRPHPRPPRSRGGSKLPPACGGTGGGSVFRRPNPTDHRSSPE